MAARTKTLRPEGLSYRNAKHSRLPRASLSLISAITMPLHYLITSLLHHFLLMNLSLAVIARSCPPENVRKFGVVPIASMLFTTVSGFDRSNTFTTATRTANNLPVKWNCFSRLTVRLEYTGKRSEFGGPTKNCCSLITLNGYPLRHSYK